MRRSLLTIFSGEVDVQSHILRLAILEKGIAYELEVVSSHSNPKAKNAVPPATIVEQDLTISDIFVALEYLDDRFPHPALIPLEPGLRARFRLLLKGIEQEAIPHIVNLNDKDPLVVSQAANGLIQFLLDVEHLFNPRTTYLFNYEFSILDCFFAPIIYKLIRVAQESKYRLPEVIAKYFRRIHDREAFRYSLSLKGSRGFLHEAIR